MQSGEALYGLPEKSHFNRLLYDLRQKVSTYESNDQQTITIKQELLGLLPKDIDYVPKPEAISPADLINHYKPIVESEFAGLLAVVPEEKNVFEPNDIVKVFADGLTYLEESKGLAAASEWSAVINPNTKSLGVDQEQKVVEVGLGRKPLSRQGMKELLLHETGVHTQRRLWGDKADFSALGYGLDGYRDAEEGLGVVVQQILSGRVTEAGTQYYTLLGLATGLDGSKKDFRHVYEIAWRRQAMLNAIKAHTDVSRDAITKAKKQAYMQCVRIFRGTPCDLPGVVYLKDIAYFKGNSKMWGYLGQIAGDISAFRQLFKGKFDPTNPEHKRLVDSATWSE